MLQRSQVLVITTGGTLDKIYRRGRGIRDLSISNDPAVASIFPRAGLDEITYIQVCAKDSLDMTEKDRNVIAHRCSRALQESILITHGTDTMIATAAVIAREKLAKTIVLTGASIPAEMKNSDADFNVGFAYSAVMHAPTGVYIAMNGRLFPWNKCEKTKSGLFVSRA